MSGANPQEYRPKCFDRYEKECQICSSDGDVHVHHIDGDRDNNDVDNLIPLCPDCHKQIHKERCHIDGMVVRELRDRLPDEKKTTPKRETTEVEYESKRVRLREEQVEWFEEHPEVKFHEFVREAIDDQRE